jgi:hypothetical protein
MCLSQIVRFLYGYEGVCVKKKEMENIADIGLSSPGISFIPQTKLKCYGNNKHTSNPNATGCHFNA